MKNTIIFFTLFYLPIALYGQVNLVPNGGFDTITQCPDETDQLLFAPPWCSATTGGTPDLLNACTDNFLLNVPNNGVCYQPAHNGSGFCRIGVYGGREYIQAKLLYNLEKNKQYFLRFWCSPDTDCRINGRKTFTDAIGLALSKVPIMENVTDNVVLKLNPAIEHRGTLITDTISWTPVCGVITAEGGENHVIIGNFRSNAETMIVIENPEIIPWAKYLYIDDVGIYEFDPLPDTLLLCEGEERTIGRGFLESAYRWNTGNTDSVITINSPGEYILTATIDNCELSDTVSVIMPLEHILQSFVHDTMICRGNEIIVNKPIPGEIQWSNGSNESSVKLMESGNHSFTITNDCGIYKHSFQLDIQDCDCRVYVPNAFSPNSDGENDFLQCFLHCDFPGNPIKFQVYDRWGNQVFENHSKNTEDLQWDGTNRGKPLETGVYIWFFEYEYIMEGKQINKILTGNSNLIR